MNLTPGLVALIGSQWFPLYADGVPDAPGARYAALWVPPPVLGDEGVGFAAVESRVIFSVSAVGRGPAEARAVAQTCIDQLAAKRPVVDGWTCGPVEHFSSQYPRRDDDDPTGSVWVCSDQFEVRAAKN